MYSYFPQEDETIVKSRKLIKLEGNYWHSKRKMYKVFDLHYGVMEMVSWQSSEILEHMYSKITKASSLDIL